MSAPQTESASQVESQNGAAPPEPEEAAGEALEPAEEAEAEAEADDGAEPAPDAHEAGLEVSEEELEREVAALLFASPEPLSTGRLLKLLSGATKQRVEAALAGLGRRYHEAGLPYEVRAIAGGWQVFTSPEMADTVAALRKARKDEKVSPAALETLAVVAYRQPVTKAEIEAIRGVQVGPILRTLVDRRLVKVTGRSEDPGHALLYGTTKLFLDVFGLASLEDLPRDAELLRD